MATTGICSSISAIGPCFISPAGIALGVDVRDLLQLQRALERDRVVDAAAEVQEVRPRCRSARRSPPLSGALFSACSSSSGSCSSASTCGFDALRRERAAHLAEAEREQVQRDELRRERLGRGDADLRARRACRRCRRSRASPCCRRRCRSRCCARPSRFASRSAASVSAVSPDCVMTTASVLRRDDRVAVAVFRSVVDFDRERARAARS